MKSIFDRIICPYTRGCLRICWDVCPAYGWNGDTDCDRHPHHLLRVQMGDHNVEGYSYERKPRARIAPCCGTTDQCRVRTSRATPRASDYPRASRLLCPSSSHGCQLAADCGVAPEAGADDETRFADICRCASRDVCPVPIRFEKDEVKHLGCCDRATDGQDRVGSTRSCTYQIGHRINCGPHPSRQSAPCGSQEDGRSIAINPGLRRYGQRQRSILLH
jgi:hypothetical protein